MLEGVSVPMSGGDGPYTNAPACGRRSFNGSPPVAALNHLSRSVVSAGLPQAGASLGGRVTPHARLPTRYRPRRTTVALGESLAWRRIVATV